MEPFNENDEVPADGTSDQGATPVQGQPGPAAPDAAPLVPLQPPPVPPPMRRPPIAYRPNEPGWWFAADGLWYPPETPPGQPADSTQISNPAPGSQNVVFNVMPAQAMRPAYVTGPAKSKIAAGLLGIFLGSLGVHRFYLGHTGLGLLMLLLTLFSVGFLAPIVGLWGFIEGVVILAGGMRTDARGVPLE